MLQFILWTTVVATLATVATVKAEQSCFARVSNPYVMFSTYTPYELVHEISDDPVYIPKCKPLQFWILSRHGTRYNDEQGINNMWTLVDLRDQIISNIENGRGTLCAQDVDNLKKWTPQAVSILSMNLAPQGYKDAYYMALRYKSRFPTLLNQSYSPDKFEIRFTNSQRTVLTAFTFLDGIFGSTVDVQLPQPISGDTLLKPSDHCTLWKKEVYNNPATTTEYSAFKKGPEIAAVLSSVSKRLGFTTSISYSVLGKMYDICRLEKAWHVGSVSPWCAAFSEDDLKVLEYKEDLSYYYRRGPGTKLNEDVGCPLAKDFLDRFSKLENGEEQPAGVFYFSHDSFMMMFFASLGIGNDTKTLTHSTYAAVSNREWRTSLLTPFGSNFVATFFKCDEGEPFRVQFRLQEKLLKLDGCKDDEWGLCDWSVIKQNYGFISKTCNLDLC